MRDDRTRVYITIDVECAEERGAEGRVRPPIGYDVRVWGRLVNQREPLGIERIMRELEACGQRGTFYMESLGARYFGVAKLREICAAIRARGHDVQLHMHPIQRRADFMSRGEQRAPDDIAAYAPAEQEALLREGKSLLVEAGVPESEIVSYRAGNFGASNAVWGAMKGAGIALSSNYNPCYFSKNCRMRLDEPALGLFVSPEEGVWELPITNFQEVRGGYRHLQISAVSVGETIRCLRRYRALGVREVTLVTHSFEFFFLDDPERRRGRPNQINLERLRGVSRYLQQHADEFEVDTVGALGQRLLKGEERAQPVRGAYPRLGPIPYARRLAEQALKRVAQRATFK
ncbi:hypothetical protein [Chondromyces apiculatus]|uniref:Polysaccharide deacetylase n=1 Tax=Chondromyces apiculatus DSM 436 TaxID=1192034 RepID=A0A017T6F9_9BACT|nr:hypothetical protein [Chondromyces apiculatus]EYF04156.1 Hypothetical protein CAP_4839 [Chondromyces apiculatus DSM 436]